MNFFQEFRTEAKLLFVVVLCAIILAVAGILLWQILLDREQLQPLDVVFETRSLEEFSRLLDDGEVKKIEYPEQYENDSLIGSVRVTLKNGKVFDSAPISAVLSILERCGSACNDVEVVKTQSPGASPQPQQTQTPETSDWQTYRNDHLGFEIRYPKNIINTFPGIIIREVDSVGYSSVRIGRFDGSCTLHISELPSDVRLDPLNYSKLDYVANDTKTQNGVRLFFGMVVVPVSAPEAMDAQRCETLFEEILLTLRFIPSVEQQEVSGEIPGMAIEPVNTSRWQSYHNEEFGFELKYPPEIFALVPVESYIYPEPTSVRRSGDKLIRAEREKLLGKEECSYGESGFVSVCNAASEYGISFAVLDKSVDELLLKASLEGYPLEFFAVEVGKSEAVTVGHGAEGYTIQYYYISLSENRSLAISVHSVYLFGSGESIPDRDLVRQILSTFRFVE